MTRTGLLITLSAAMTLAVAIPFATVFGQSGDDGDQFGSAQLALGTSFTYQGRLTDDGDLGDRLYDMRFILFDAASGGAQVGTTQAIEDVNVSDGYFTVGLDFGATAFNGDARWLEIAVKLPAQANFTVLNPRQPLSAVPYALYALNGSGGGGLTLPASASANSASPTPGLNISQTGSGDGMVLSRAPATPAAGDTLDVTNTGDGTAFRATGNGTSSAIIAVANGAGATAASLTGDVALNVDGAIKVSGDAPAFVHEVTNGNKCEGDGASVIDNPLANGQPNAVLLVTFRGVGNSLDQPATAFGVMYDDGADLDCDNDRWLIYSLDSSVNLDSGMEFNVLVIQR